MIALYIFLGIVGIIVLDLLFAFILSLTVRAEEYDKQNKLFLFVYILHVKIAMFFSNLKITLKNGDKVDRLKENYLFVGNHRSNYDPFIVNLKLNKGLAFISKPENLKIPVFGKMAKRCCCMAIDRENPKNAIKTLNRAATLIKSGEVSVGVYPEGKRSKSEEMLEFHDGVFKIAQKAQCPIVVGHISGTEKVHKRAPFLRTHITLDIVEVIMPEEFNGLSSHEISDRVRQKLEECQS